MGALGTAAGANAQSALSPSGGLVGFTGAFQNFTIPDVPGSTFRFTLLGGDGGEGATTRFDVVVGTSAWQIKPGASVRFVVGQGGADHVDLKANKEVRAAGGGGTGLLDNADGVSWELLAVAGGGGGASSASNFGCNWPNGEGDDGAVDIADLLVLSNFGASCP